MSTDQFRLEPQLPEEQKDSHFEDVDTAESYSIPGRGEVPTYKSLVAQENIPLSVEAVTLAGHMGRIQAKLSAEMQRLEDAGTALAQVVNGITPTDQASYAELCERLEDNNQFLKGVDEFIEPWKKLFYRPYTAVLERAKQIIYTPTASLSAGKARRLMFEREIKAAEERENARLRKEQEDREAQQRLDAAVTAEELGLSETAVDTILTQPSVTPTPVAAPMISRPTGVRKIAPNWQAELADKQEFWKWARQQKEMPACLLIDQPTMNREARTHKATLGQRFPGWRGVNKGGD